VKILFVDLQYDYGMKDRGINQIGEIGFHQSFLKLGHQVECFYYDDYLKNLEALQEAVQFKADQVKPDLIYFVLFGEQFKPETLKALSSKYKTINWFGDDQWRFENFTKKYAPLFTWSVTTDPFAVSKYRKLGIKNVILSQWAALNLNIPVQAPSQYKYDVSFIGSSHSVRRWFIDTFRKKGINVATFGYGWPSGPISLEQMMSVFQESKINLNLGNSVHLDMRYLLHNLKNPIVAWKSSKASSQIKARNFEIPYYGGFQLTEYVPTIESYFNLGQELVCFSNVDEALMLTQHYLENDSEREIIKNAGIKKAREFHTYFNRQKEIFLQL